MIFYFSIVQVNFVFYKLNFIVLFPNFIKCYHVMFIIIVFWLGNDRPSGLFFMHVFLSILMPLFFLSSSVSLAYFILVSIRECLGKHSFMSSPFSITILNGSCFFRETIWSFSRRIASQKLIIINNQFNTGYSVKRCVPCVSSGVG